MSQVICLMRKTIKLHVRSLIPFYTRSNAKVEAYVFWCIVLRGCQSTKHCDLKESVSRFFEGLKMAQVGYKWKGIGAPVLIE